MNPDVVAEVAEEVAEEAEVIEEYVAQVPFSEWLPRTLDLFSDTLRFIMREPLLRFFAVFGVFWVAVLLCLYLLRTGKSLSR